MQRDENTDKHASIRRTELSLEEIEEKELSKFEITIDNKIILEFQEGEKTILTCKECGSERWNCWVNEEDRLSYLCVCGECEEMRFVFLPFKQELEPEL